MSKVSVIISNRNDTVMLSVTIRSAIEALKALKNIKCEGDIVICDNSDEDIFKSLDSYIPHGYIEDGQVKVVRQTYPCLFTARESCAENSDADYILCLDSHILCGHNMIKDLVAFMDYKAYDKYLGFVHAPISWAHHHERSAKHDRDMSVNELGDWNTHYKECRKITWKGMPWICRRDWFLNYLDGLGAYGALSEHRISWGGGDMHIGIKPWLLGFCNWAIPTSPAIHIGPFPKHDTVNGNSHETKVGPYNYRLWSTSGNGPHALGFLISCYILGGEAMIERNRTVIKERFGRFIDVDGNISHAIELGKKEKAWLDQRKVLSFERLLEMKPWESI